MRPSLFLLPLLFLSSLCAAEPEFPLTGDSKPQADVAKGELIKSTYTARNGSVFPGTEREYTLYLPHGFDKAKPAPFMVFQDGLIYQAPVVFDNLIAKKEIPPLVGILVKPGVVPAANENALPRFNRSYEYDSVTDTYARFLIDELLPAIEQKHGIKLSTDPNDAAISGNSSGGIAAFMVAWHRPDRFRRVFTGVGTYVGIHGGDQLPVLVRKIEPKPLRVFLQSGTGDNNLYCGDWWVANQMMERSLTWAGYDVNHAWGEGGHNQKHASQIFPDVMRWLWKGWPESKEVKANPRGESKWRGYEVVGDGEWTSLKGYPVGSSLVVNEAGQVHVGGGQTGRCVRKDGLTFENIEHGPPPNDLPLGWATWTPDQSQVLIGYDHEGIIIASTVRADGKAANVQRFGVLDRNSNGAVEPKGMCTDTNGWLYVATTLGIQVLDQCGRVNFIIPTPQQPHDVCFGGKDFDELFIACGYKIYKRTTKARGIVSGQMPPIKPAPPKL